MFNENTMLLMLYVAQLLHISFMTINIKERIETERNGTDLFNIFFKGWGNICIFRQ